MSATPFELWSRRLGESDGSVVVIDNRKSGAARVLKQFRGKSAASRARVYLEALRTGWFAGRAYEQQQHDTRPANRPTSQRRLFDASDGSCGDVGNSAPSPERVV